MKARITATLLKDVEVKTEPYEIVDDLLTGFLARVQPTGKVTFYFAYRTSDGRRLRSRIGAYPAVTAPNARLKAEKLSAEVVLGSNPQQEKQTERIKRQRAKHESLAGFIEHKYKDWALSHQRRGQETLDLLHRNFKHLQAKNLKDISAWEIQKWRTERSKAGLSPSTINRSVTTLKAVLNRALEWGVIETNPLQTIKPLKLDSKGVIRYLSEDEEHRLRAALNDRQQELVDSRNSGNAWREARGKEKYPDLTGALVDYLKPLVLVVLNTGIRRGEAFSLKWENVNFERKSLVVMGSNAKSGHTRHVPLNTESVTILREWFEKAESELVFPSTVTKRKLVTVQKVWAPLMRRAGIERFRFHDLRHTFASKLVMEGVDLYTVKELMGHSTIQMTERYAHLAPEHKASAVEKLVKSNLKNY